MTRYIERMTDWGADDLTKFFDMARGNQQANRTKFLPAYEKIRRIDDCLAKAGRNLINVKPIMLSILLLRCQYAYKTAASLALAGQVVETFVMMRSVLEYAGYGLVIFEDPSMENIFISRHMSDAEKRKQREEFNSSTVRVCIARFDTKLAENFVIFYDRCIDFGGHPNPHGTFSAMQLEEKDGSTSVTTLAISTNEEAVAHALKSVAQIGFTALYVFQHIFKERFELLGIRSEIDALRNAGGL